MSTRLVIFGAGELARLVELGFSQIGYDVVGHTMHGEWIADGDDAVAFEEVERAFPPESHAMFVAVGYTRVNRARAEICASARAKGYELATYLSPQAIVSPAASIGSNCFVFEGCIVQPFVTIGDNVIMWSGSQVAHDSRIADNCFLGPSATIAGNVVVGEKCFIGANATIRDGVRIAADCVIGAGAVIKRDTQQGEVYATPPTQPAERKSWELEAI